MARTPALTAPTITSPSIERVGLRIGGHVAAVDGTTCVVPGSPYWSRALVMALRKAR
jgi:hypothetical protein